MREKGDTPSHQCDGRYQTSVIGFATVDAAAVGIEPLLICVSVEPEIAELANTLRREFRADIGWQVEHEVALLHGCAEKKDISGVLCKEPITKFGADFIGASGNRRPQNHADRGA